MLSDKQITELRLQHKHHDDFIRAIEVAARRECATEIAKWYGEKGWMLDEDDVLIAIIQMLE